jgi:MFS family permease
VIGRLFERTYVALFREYPPLLRLAVVTGASQLAFALVNVYALPVYLIQDLRVSGLAVGGISATFLACEMALKFPLGRLSDRLGRKPFVVLGPLLICLNPVIIVRLPTRLWALVFPVRALDGVGAAALWPPLFAMVGDLVDKRSRAAAMSVMNTVYVGAIGAAAAMGSFADYFTGSHHSPFYLASAFLFLSAVTGYLGLPVVRGAAGDPHEPAVAAPSMSALTQPRLPPYRLPLVLLVSILMTLGVLMLASFLIVYVKVELHLSGLHTGALLAALAVPVLVVGLPLGHAADRWGKSRAVRVSLAVSAATMWLVPSCRSVLTFALVGLVLVIAHILGTPAWLALVSELAPRRRRGGVMGIVATAEGAGAALAPLLGGWLWDIQHSYIFYGSAVLLTLAALVAAFTLRGEPRGEQPEQAATPSP